MKNSMKWTVSLAALAIAAGAATTQAQTPPGAKPEAGFNKTVNDKLDAKQKADAEKARKQEQLRLMEEQQRAQMEQMQANRPMTNYEMGQRAEQLKKDLYNRALENQKNGGGVAVQRGKGTSGSGGASQGGDTKRVADDYQPPKSQAEGEAMVRKIEVERIADLEKECKARNQVKAQQRASMSGEMAAAMAQMKQMTDLVANAQMKGSPGVAAQTRGYGEMAMAQIAANQPGLNDEDCAAISKAMSDQKKWNAERDKKETKPGAKETKPDAGEPAKPPAKIYKTETDRIAKLKSASLHDSEWYFEQLDAEKGDAASERRSKYLDLDTQVRETYDAAVAAENAYKANPSADKKAAWDQAVRDYETLYNQRGQQRALMDNYFKLHSENGASRYVAGTPAEINAGIDKAKAERDRALKNYESSPSEANRQEVDRTLQDWNDAQSRVAKLNKLGQDYEKAKQAWETSGDFQDGVKYEYALRDYNREYQSLSLDMNNYMLSKPKRKP